jgi:hypothetical protein
MKAAYTERQGQYLAYFHQYSILNGCAPSEADMQRFFQVPPDRASDGAHAGAAGLHSTRSQPGAQHHPNHSAGVVALFATPLARIIHEGSSRKRGDAKRDGHPEP